MTTPKAHRPRLRSISAMLPVLVAVAGLAAPTFAQHGGHAGDDPHADHAAMVKAGTPGTIDKAGSLDIPDVTVYDQTGAKRNFYSELVEGKTVAMNFVFTTCTTICPPMGANFGRLRKELGERAGTDVHLISVSVDPVTDSPQRLAAWSEQFGAGPGWTLVTGKKTEITRLLKALEVFAADVNEHSPQVLIGNEAAGEWTRAHGLAPPAKLAELLTEAEHAEHGGGGGDGTGTAKGGR